MCGVVCVISPGVPIRPQLLDAIRDRLVHRGPDSSGSWIHPGGRVALAHRRLSIIDRSHEADQPMQSRDGQDWIVFNGEIYNYVELRRELQAAGVEFRTRSDTEVLLAALEVWGEAALSRLNGMFAFVMWDGRKRRLLVARDRFGEKPMFIGRGSFGTVVIASEMKAVLAHPLIACVASERAIERFAGGDWLEDDESTFFKGIERVPPAHAIWLQEDGTQLRRWRYWTPDYCAVDESIRPRDAVERFSELLKSSLRMRLRADVPIGSSLSGGLDSSVIVGCLSRERDSARFTQNTFSACFPADETMSEHREVGAVAGHTGVRSHVVVPQGEGLAAEAARLHWHQEEPFHSASIYLQWCVARLAKEHGTTVLLDGQGADELLGGYQYYFRLWQLDLLDRGELARCLRETQRFTSRLVGASGRYSAPERRFDAAAAYTADQIRGYGNSRPAPGGSRYATGVAPVAAGGRLRRTLSEALLYNSLPLLLRFADRNSMAFSREARLPYLDYELVDFCLRLPENLLIRHGWQKWVLRMAAGDCIPASIRWRADKVGYAAPLDAWLRESLKDWAIDRIFDPRLADVPGYQRAAVETLWAEHQNATANHSWAIWRWISLVEWLDTIRAGWWRSGQPSISLLQ